MRSATVPSFFLTLLTVAGCGFQTPMASPATVSSTPFRKGGQAAWFHDEGHSGGYFHTYDEFRVGSADAQPRKVHVFLPRDYEESGERYPVVYMNDGQTAFFPGGVAGKSWDVAGTLSSLYAQDAIRKVIVVAIHPLDRDFEYTHEEVLPGRPWGGLSRYAQYVATDVKPWVDTYYRTLPTRENTAIVGSSHGGLAAFFIAGAYARQFGFAACLSPSFWVGVDTVSYLFGTLRGSSLLQATSSGWASEKHPRLWLDWGLVRDGGFHNEWIEAHATKRGREMSALLQQDYGYKEGSDLFVVEDPAGSHTEESWARRFPDVLKAFAGK